MKKKAWIILAIFSLITLIFYVCQTKPPSIDRASVTKIEVRSDMESVALSSEDVDTFFELFSNAKHGGTINPGDGVISTPIYGFTLYFSDGTNARLWECRTNALEAIFPDREYFYLESTELVDFLEEMVDKYYSGQ